MGQRAPLGDNDEDRFWRKLILPEEGRLANGVVYRGGYRWFRSPNVVPIERYRNKRKKAALNINDIRRKL
jgi:hypothetical protein